MPKEMAERMASAIPNATLVTMLGVYHHLVLDAPDDFSRILDEFLRGLPD
jgi:pimeloyl-ACP methyl ester carboxylesterase